MLSQSSSIISPSAKRPFSQTADRDDDDESEVALKKSRLTQEIPIIEVIEDFDVEIHPGNGPDPVIRLDQGNGATILRLSKRLEHLLKPWQEEELSRFYSGLARYGPREGELIAKRVGSKTVMQVGRLLILLKDLSRLCPNDEEPEEAIEIPPQYSQQVARQEELRGGRIAKVKRVTPLPPSMIAPKREKPPKITIPQIAIERPRHSEPTTGRELRKMSKVISREALLLEARAQRKAASFEDESEDAPLLFDGARLHLFVALYPRIRALVHMSLLFALERNKSAVTTQERTNSIELVDVQRAIGLAHDLEEEIGDSSEVTEPKDAEKSEARDQEAPAITTEQVLAAQEDPPAAESESEQLSEELAAGDGHQSSENER